MKKISSITSGIFVFVAAGTLILTATQPVQAQDAATTTPRNSQFCTKTLPALKAKYAERVTSTKNNAAAKSEERNKKLAENRAAWDKKIADIRSKLDAKRAANYEKLTQKATTDEEKTAVETYKASVEAAITQKRAENDAVRQQFRVGLDSTLVTNAKTVQAEATKYANGLEVAISNAEAKCAANPATGVKGIRDSLRTDLKSATSAFKVAKNAISAKAKRAELETTKRAALQENNQARKDSVKKSAEELRKILGTKKAETPQEKAIREAKAYQFPEGTVCADVITPGIHLETKATYTFPSACLPPGWDKNK